MMKVVVNLEGVLETESSHYIDNGMAFNAITVFCDIILQFNETKNFLKKHFTSNFTVIPFY